jgi:hypothetical protein
MQPQEIAIEVPSQGARRAPGEGSHNGWQQRRRFAARQKTDGVLRLLRGAALALVSRALGIPAARLTLWREAFREAGQDALHKPPLDDHDRALARVRHKRGESTMAMELWREKRGRREPSRP